ncbi:MAG: hypothetical protein ACPGUD_03180 [Parashewanella sp.]
MSDFGSISSIPMSHLSHVGSAKGSEEKQDRKIKQLINARRSVSDTHREQRHCELAK